MPLKLNMSPGPPTQARAVHPVPDARLPSDDDPRALDRMFRMCRIYADNLPVVRQVLEEVQRILREQFPGISEDKWPAETAGESIQGLVRHTNRRGRAAPNRARLCDRVLRSRPAVWSSRLSGQRQRHQRPRCSCSVVPARARRHGRPRSERAGFRECSGHLVGAINRSTLVVLEGGYRTHTFAYERWIFFPMLYRRDS